MKTLNKIKLRKYLNIGLPLLIMIPYVGFVLHNRTTSHYIRKEEIIAKRKEQKEKENNEKLLK